VSRRSVELTRTAIIAVAVDELIAFYPPFGVRHGTPFLLRVAFYVLARDKAHCHIVEPLWLRFVASARAEVDTKDGTFLYAALQLRT
jgi:hypothetical protein